MLVVSLMRLCRMLPTTGLLGSNGCKRYGGVVKAAPHLLHQSISSPHVASKQNKILFILIVNNNIYLLKLNNIVYTKDLVLVDLQKQKGCLMATSLIMM